MNIPVMDEMRRCGALLQGHFQLSSGRHSTQYFQCALLFEDPLVGRRLSDALADRIRREIQPPVQRIVGVALGGILVGHEVAAVLGVPSCFVERGGDGRMALRRGFQIRDGERVAIVEDVITTGRSAAEAAAVVRRAGGEVAAQAAIVRRGQGVPEMDKPLVYVLQVDVESWDAAACPLCEKGIPAVKPGSRPDLQDRL